MVSSLSFLGATSLMTGCSDDSSGASPDAGPQQCPDNVTAAQGAACTVERSICPISYECVGNDPIRETAECTCTSSAWACVDPKGNDVQAGQTPACTGIGTGNDKDCSPTETEGATCHTQGLVCSYQGATCAGQSTPLTDTCQCNAVALVDGGTAFALHCEPGQCPVPLGDAGPQDAGGD
ncbi:MAG: hypothetical protein ACRELY_17045 [Polyangiaceae bacterium]